MNAVGFRLGVLPGLDQDGNCKPILPLDPERLFARGHLVHETEQRLLDLFSKGLLSGTTQTCIGREFCQMAIFRALDHPQDAVLSTYRNYGHLLSYSGGRLLRSLASPPDESLIVTTLYRNKRMSSDQRAAIIERLRERLNEVAANLGNDASRMSQTDIIPDKGVVDSAGLLKLVVWYDDAFSLDLQPHAMTVDNFGSLAGMADFTIARPAR